MSPFTLLPDSIHDLVKGILVGGEFVLPDSRVAVLVDNLDGPAGFRQAIDLNVDRFSAGRISLLQG